ncbi:DHA2 family efflux MFS transporter permease subunit [Metapseudomonas resinovorans]|uniref:Multidrug resistance transporter EmrB n=1 Tax=Metapseudomonas resinovorans NBRC 106553 TaxID=1245471 RepID=S6AEY1_METRE|nr:DHA2 family efflux MFS transporter permease subunit [Pseudomonas resinovorans]BAN48372.1 multidrug resistance transporter EmrB [Pseudomonas resinovorans NBRC 106553]
MDTTAVQDGASKRWLITVSVMLATIMQALDTTIANVALPHMQGSMGTTQDQISWVLTSYIVAAAICMPLTGFIAARFGRKRLFMWSIVGFTIASMLCGAAQSLEQIVLFRLLQGVFGASLVPLSQAVLLDTYPKEQHGSAMAIWGVGVMVGPILGPSLGGWLTEYYNWRWVFYINLPFGLLAWFGLASFLKETPIEHERRFDLAGFALLALAIGAFQLMLDRGESQDWFQSGEILIEGALAALGLYLFVVHVLTHRHPFIDPAMFRDRNLSVGLIFIFMLGIMLFATMTLLPPFMQNLMGYPVIDVGNLIAPRGLGTMAAMLLVGRLINRFDPRAMIGLGLLLTALSLWEMTGFTAEIGSAAIVRSGLVQGFGLGLIFVPLSTLTFSTLAPRYRNEGAALFSLMRNVGSGIGISLVISYLAQRTQINHAVFSDLMTPFNQALTQATESGALNISSPAGLVALNAEVTRQATVLAYLQDFRLMMFVTLASLPLLLLLRKPPKGAAAMEPHAVMD